jgi:putative addiction module component (TIGR02574 family)
VSTDMPDQVSDLVKRGRALPPEDRERLVDQLLESLNEAAANELDAAWEAEIERRLAEHDQGTVQAIDAEEVFAKARRNAQ